MKPHDRTVSPQPPASPLEKLEESSFLRQPMSDRQWRAHLAALKIRLGSLDREQLHAAAGAIRSARDWLDRLLEQYCQITCPACPDVCCHATRVFFNRTDLLAILALGLNPPPGQTRSVACAPCRYLTPAGCSLERILRPYVCVWYLCEAQMDLFGKEPASVQRRFTATLESLRRARLRLESLFEGSC